MRQAMTGWLLVAVCLVLLGGGAFIRTQMPYGVVSAATIKEWRQYATEVEQGKVPSAQTTRMLTETAIAQHEYARSAIHLLRFVSVGVAILGLFLVIDLARYRTRHTRPPAGS